MSILSVNSSHNLSYKAPSSTSISLCVYNVNVCLYSKSHFSEVYCVISEFKTCWPASTEQARQVQSFNDLKTICLFDGYSKDGDRSWTYVFSGYNNGSNCMATKMTRELSPVHAIFSPIQQQEAQRLQWRFARGSIMGDEQQQKPEKCNGDLYWVASTYVISPIWNIYGSPDIIDPGMGNPRWLIQLNWGTVPITLYWTVHTQPKIYTRVMINNDYTILKCTICNNLYTSKPVLNIWFACIYGQSSLLRPHAGWPKVSTKHEICQETQSPRVEETKKRATGTHGTLTSCWVFAIYKSVTFMRMTSPVENRCGLSCPGARGSLIGDVVQLGWAPWRNAAVLACSYWKSGWLRRSLNWRLISQVEISRRRPDPEGGGRVLCVTFPIAIYALATFQR